MPRICIDRCVCKQISFAELLEMTHVLGPDIDLIALSTGASIECGTCRPWLQKAIQSGESAFYPDADSLPDGKRLLHHFGPAQAE